MCNFGYDEIVLLNNLIYLEWYAKDDTYVYDLVSNILSDNNLELLIGKMKNCMGVMEEEEWREILLLILKNENLKDVKIRGLENSTNTGMRVACFVYDSEVLVVFRGTSTISEWEDNGQGAYEYDTAQQIYALNYINNLSYDKVIVSGHSKGGNKAQYTAILSPKVERCISINGQGFSNEFLEKYNKNIEENKEKIVRINCKYDYVSALLNSINCEVHYINTKFQVNPLFYHKANILIDKDGHLCEEDSQCVVTKILNSYTTSLISDLPKELKELTANGLVCAIESVFCKQVNVENIFKSLGGILILFSYGKYFSIKESLAISYTILEMLLIPLFLWNDIIEVDEKKSKTLYKNVLEKIDVCSHAFLDKLKIIDNEKYGISNKVEKKIDAFIKKINSLDNSELRN